MSASGTAPNTSPTSRSATSYVRKPDQSAKRSATTAAPSATAAAFPSPTGERSQAGPCGGYAGAPPYIPAPPYAPVPGGPKADAAVRGGATGSGPGPPAAGCGGRTAWAAGTAAAAQPEQSVPSGVAAERRQWAQSMGERSPGVWTERAADARTRAGRTLSPEVPRGFRNIRFGRPARPLEIVRPYEPPVRAGRPATVPRPPRGPQPSLSASPLKS